MKQQRTKLSHLIRFNPQLFHIYGWDVVSESPDLYIYVYSSLISHWLQTSLNCQCSTSVTCELSN